LFLTAAIATASFMEILDMTIVNVSVPAISGSLGVSTSEGTWAVSSYMLAAAVMQPLTGWIGRRFGEVRTFVTSILCSCASRPCAVSRPACRCWSARVSSRGWYPVHDVGGAGHPAAHYPIERRAWRSPCGPW